MVKVLGLVKAIHVGASAPTNTSMIWYDTVASLHKYYSGTTSTWTSLATGFQNWSDVLAVSPNSGAVSPIIDSGQSIDFSNSSFKSSLDTLTLTADRALKLPNSSGTLALLSDIPASSGLSGILSVSNLTSGQNLVTSNGDKIVAQNGSGELNLRDTTDGKVTLSGDNLNLVGSTNASLASDETTVESSTGELSLKGNSSISLYVNGTTKVAEALASNDTFNIVKKLSLTPTLSVTPTSSTIDLTSSSVVEFDTTFSSFVVGKITGGSNGRVGYVINTGLGNLSINNNASGAGADKILTPSGSSMLIGPNQSVALYYSGNKSAWYVL